MMLARSTACFARFTKLVAIAGALGAASLLLRGERPVRACSGGESFIGELITFDSAVLGDPALDVVAYDPYIARFGGYTPGAGADDLVADWHDYLAGAATDEDWRAVLFKTTVPDIVAFQRRLAGMSTTVPAGFGRTALWAAISPAPGAASASPAARARLTAAFAVVRLAHEVEPSAAFFETWDQAKAAARPAPAARLLQAATAGMTAAHADRFIAQRYAFQAARILFYQHDAAGLVRFFDQHTSVLTAPSAGLGWRARYYLAGVLAGSGQRARADLELARVHANYPPLAGAAEGDFRPQNETDWQGSLALAHGTRERTELWRMAGVRFDGISASREILKLDPRSNLLGLLVVRELARAESMIGRAYDMGDAKTLHAAMNRALGEVEQLALQIAAIPGADRPWLMDLVAGHVAAKRGDLATARTRLERALAGKPGDAAVASQAKASLALALVANWKIDAGHERELALAMTTLDKAYRLEQTLRTEVRDQLAKRYLAVNRLVDAEYLHPGSVDPRDDDSGFSPHPGALHWADAGFIKQLIARRAGATTAFDHFVVEGAFPEPALEQELGLRHALDGDFAAAKAVFAAPTAASSRLEVDPFVVHIKDCRDCDEQKYARSPWTHATVIGKLAQLAAIASGTGEPAAEAAIQIGNALYNFTWFGNARRVLRATHQDTFDARPAERWYKRAYELTRNRELKAKAAYLAAKAERENRVDAVVPADAGDHGGELPTPTTWFKQLQRLADTRYYKEVLQECGTFSRWVPGDH